ncbi:MAG: peptidoglycan DD-metalloendopeptidase family protein [Alcanivoracaceae bacterium]|nr:peptidoglycan DD-metalloendopeptidase family protein [Alcanivoracaceae bacterium]
MIKRSMFFLILFSFVAIGQPPNAKSQPKSEIELEANIANIKQKLRVLKNALNKAYGDEQLLLGKLELQDKSISNVSKQIGKGREQLQSIQKHIQQTSEKIEQNSKRIEKQKGQIVDLLKLQVYLNHDKTLKMLLIDPNNGNSTQTKHQIKYLQNRLYGLIKEVALQINELEQFKRHSISLQEQETIKQQGLLVQQDDLQQQRKQRLSILTRLKHEIAKYETQGESLNKDQKRLQQLLSEIQVLLSDLPKSLGSNKPFRKLKARMDRPVVGQYIRSFHSKRSENTQWDGVVIAANLGDSVNAIAYGRVAFADWLRGFGMLVILDHQDGYMSLYGFNESINVDVGDWVDKGQEIATIGNSGTLATPGLYFEIRKDAMPLNPKIWVK